MEALLIEILAELRKLNNPQPLGLLNPGLKIYANRSNPPHLWYSIDPVDHTTPVGISQSALRGVIKEIKTEIVTRRGKDSLKLLIRIQGDRTYQIESGIDSVFSKGLLGAIASLTPAELRDPVVITVRAGNDDAVLLPGLFTATVPVFSPITADTDMNIVLNKAIENVTAATATTVAIPEVPKAAIVIPPVAELAATAHPAKAPERDKYSSSASKGKKLAEVAAAAGQDWSESEEA